LEKLRELGIPDKPVVVGGIIPEKDERVIRQLGVQEVFHPYTPLAELAARVKDLGAGYRRRLAPAAAR
jgi:methylmalonyl-CoA mutase cobalamin-binding domain/chain